MLTAVIYAIIRYFLSHGVHDYEFTISRKTVRFHSNWTTSLTRVRGLDEFHNALKLQGIDNLDVSFAMSSSLGLGDMSQIFPTSLKQYKKIKLNFGNVPLGNKGVDYIISLIPNGVEDLELYFDSTQLDDGYGNVLGKRLSALTTLKKLKISLILAGIKDEGIKNFFENHKIGEKLTDLNLIFIGNSLTHESVTPLPQYLSANNLEKLTLNLYANNLGYQGGELLGESIKNLGKNNKIKDLSVDLYFSNITEVGTKSVAEAVKDIKSLESLEINLDFNYIKNEGGKYLGDMFKGLQKLKKINIGVASKNFGYLGFKGLIDGLKTQDQL